MRRTARAICEPEMRNGLLARSHSCICLCQQICERRSVSQARFRFLTQGASRRPWNRTTSRGVKSKAVISLSELQGNAPEVSHGLPSTTADGKSYPTVVLQALNNMEKYENCVLLTRVGSFYEVCCYTIFTRALLTRSPALF